MTTLIINHIPIPPDRNKQNLLIHPFKYATYLFTFAELHIILNDVAAMQHVSDFALRFTDDLVVFVLLGQGQTIAKDVFFGQV